MHQIRFKLKISRPKTLEDNFKGHTTSDTTLRGPVLEPSFELLLNEAFKYRYFSGLGKLWKIPASRQFLGKLPASDQSSTSQQTKNTILSKQLMQLLNDGQMIE